MIVSWSLKSGVQSPESKVKTLESDVGSLIKKSTKEEQPEQMKAKIIHLRNRLKTWEIIRNITREQLKIAILNCFGTNY